jgi:small subunit ribosomal protein S4
MIAIRDRVASRDLIDRNLNSLQQKKIPSHLTLTTTNRTALVNQLVNRESIGVQINELLVVEYYSRQA